MFSHSKVLAIHALTIAYNLTKSVADVASGPKAEAVMEETVSGQLQG